MDQVLPRRGGERVGERGFLRLLELRAERGFALVQSARELVRGLVGQSWPREHERPGAERRDRHALALVTARRQRDRLDEGIFRKDALQLLRGRGDKARARGPIRYRYEPRPADASAPLRRGAAVEDHLRAVARAREIDRREVLVD